jgi:hypothetical protein
MARPSKYNKDLAFKILGKLAEGMSLRKICAQSDMPAISTVLKWRAEKEEFSEQYAHARELQAFGMFDELIDIADESDKDNVAVDKLRIDSRKWYLSKVLPKVCGDKIQTEHTGEVKINQVTRKIIE